MPTAIRHPEPQAKDLGSEREAILVRRPDSFGRLRTSSSLHFVPLRMTTIWEEHACL